MTRPLRQHYLDYLAVLNERRFADLAGFVADQLTYNGEPLSRQQYEQARRDEAEAIPDLRYDAEVIVVQDAWLACIIRFECTPIAPFLGFEPTGRPFRFTEHVFYRFEHDRIVEVRSLLDLAAIRRQAGGSR